MIAKERVLGWCCLSDVVTERDRPQAPRPGSVGTEVPSPADLFFTVDFYFWQRVIHIVTYWQRSKKVPFLKQI